MLNFDEKRLFCPAPAEPCEKPRFFGGPDPHHAHMSMPERVDETARLLRDTLDRLKMFEADLYKKVEDAQSVLMQDNVTFKKLCEDAIRDFIATVKSEVNLFETQIQTTLKLFEDSTNDQLAEQMERITQAELYMKANLNQTLENLLHDMEESGSLVGVIDSEVFINVKRFGATGDGVTDDTQAIKDAISSLANGGTVYFPNGVYMVSGDIPVTSHITLKGDTNSIIRRTANNLETYNIFTVDGYENVVFEKMRIEGERDAHTGVTGEWGMGISFKGAKNCTVRDCVIMGCWGDGIYIGSYGVDGCENIDIFNNTIEYNRRNGISVINVDGLNVADCLITRTGGTAPEHGICFECNVDGEQVKNANVYNCVFTNNKYGVGFGGSANLYEVIVDGCTFNATNGVYVCRTMLDGVGGFIIVRNSMFNCAIGAVFDAKTPEGIPVTFDGCQFNVSNIGVRIGYPGLNVDAVLGGIDINNCYFSKWGETGYPVMIRTGDHENASYRDININAKINGITRSVIFISSPVTGSIRVNDDCIPVKTVTADATFNATFLYNKGDVNVAGGNKIITLAENVPYGYEVEYRIIGSNANSATFALEDGIFAQVNNNTNNLTVTGIYTTVRFRHESANRWSFRKIANT